MNDKPWFAIVNPASANGRTGKEWPKIYKVLTENKVDVKYALTTSPGDATELTRRALRKFSQILSVGGDGTLNEVVNGFFENDILINPEASLGILSHGTGGDFIRSLNQRRDIASFLDVLRREQIVSIDCGQVQYKDFLGDLRNRYFLNVADVGLGGETVARVNRHSKFFGGKLSFLFGSLISILSYRNKHMKCILDGKVIVHESVNSVMVSNGRYIGGGMMIAPDADLSDGYFDVVILGDFTPLELLRHLPKIYRGEHVQVPGVSIYRGKDVTIYSDPSGLLDLDGEQPGYTPVQFSLLRGAIRIWI